jgi:hypothetical protein
MHMDAHAEPTPEELVPLQPAPEPDTPIEAAAPAVEIPSAAPDATATGAPH